MTTNQGGESWQITQYYIIILLYRRSYYIEGHINFPPYLGLQINKENTGHGNMVKITYIPGWSHKNNIWSLIHTYTGFNSTIQISLIANFTLF